MFWRFGAAKVSKIDTILQRPDFTLEDVLAEEDILQECKAENEKLVEYIAGEVVMNQLLDLVTVEPPPGTDEKSRFRFPSIASEVLSSDSLTISDALWSPAHIQRVWNILETPNPLHPLVGSFFLKLLVSLLAKKKEEVVEYIRARPFLIDKLLTHLETPAVADALTAVCVSDGSKAEPSFQEFLVTSCHLIERIVALFDPASNTSFDKLCSAGQLVQDIVFSYRREVLTPLENSPEESSTDFATSNLQPLYTQLMSEAIIESLMSNVLRLHGVNLEKGLQCLHDLLNLPPRGEEERPYRPADIDRHSQDIISVLNVVARHVEDLHGILVQEPEVKSIVTASGVIVPLGSTRVKTVRLLQSLMETNNEKVFEEIAKHETLKLCLSFFFKYPDNNFVQRHVAAMIKSIISVPDGAHPLYRHLIVDCQLLSLVLSGWSDSVECEAQRKGTRRGYIGHLALIATSLAEMPPGPNSPAELSPENVRSEWEDFVANELKAHHELIHREIGGPKPERPPTPPSSDDEPGGQDIAAAQAEYMRFFQQHAYGTQVPDDFAFNDDNEPENISSSFGQEGDFGDKQEFDASAHDWTSGATNQMADDEWTERQIEDEVQGHSDSSDENPMHQDSDSDSDDAADPTAAQPHNIPLSPMGAKAVAAMPTADPFASPHVRVVRALPMGDLDDSKENWASFPADDDDEPRAMDVQPATMTDEQYDAMLDKQLAEPLEPNVEPLQIGLQEEIAERLAQPSADRPLPPTPFALSESQLLTAEQEAADNAAAAAKTAADTTADTASAETATETAAPTCASTEPVVAVEDIAPSEILVTQPVDGDAAAAAPLDAPTEVSNA